MIGRVEDIFDPSYYSKVSLPLEEAEALPRWCFTSEEFYQREIERIFLRSWMFVGRAEEAANPGDYFTRAAHHHAGLSGHAARSRQHLPAPRSPLARGEGQLRHAFVLSLPRVDIRHRWQPDRRAGHEHHAQFP